MYYLWALFRVPLKVPAMILTNPLMVWALILFCGDCVLLSVRVPHHVLVDLFPLAGALY